MTLGKWISAPAAVLVLISFFLPWSLGISGYDLARLIRDPLLWTIPLAAIVTLCLIFAGGRYMVNEPIVSGGQIALSLVPLLYLAYRWVQANAGGIGLFEVGEALDLGFISSIGGLFLILIGAVVALLQSRSVSQESAFAIGYQSRTDTVGSIASPQYASFGDVNNASYAPFPSPATFPAAAPVPAAGSYESPIPASPQTEVLRSEPQVLAWLVVGEGPRTGYQFRLFDVTSIGRDTANEVILDDTSLSNQHARIKLEEGVFFLYDLASTNGTFLYIDETSEWQRVYREPIHDGQKIKLGRTILHFMHVAPTTD